MNCIIDCLDAYTLITVAVSYAFFLVAHVIVLRTRKSASALKVLVLVFGVGLLLNVAAMLWPLLLSIGILAGYSAASIIIAALVAWLIYGILGFNYVIGFFNLGETARRVRLVHELRRTAKPMTLDDIYAVYNADIILNTRMERLMRSGQVRYDGKVYRIGRRVVLTQARIVWLTKWLVGVSADRF